MNYLLTSVGVQKEPETLNINSKFYVLSFSNFKVVHDLRDNLIWEHSHYTTVHSVVLLQLPYWDQKFSEFSLCHSWSLCKTDSCCAVCMQFFHLLA